MILTYLLCPLFMNLCFQPVCFECKNTVGIWVVITLHECNTDTLKTTKHHFIFQQRNRFAAIEYAYIQVDNSAVFIAIAPHNMWK